MQWIVYIDENQLDLLCFPITGILPDTVDTVPTGETAALLFLQSAVVLHFKDTFGTCPLCVRYEPAPRL